MCLHCTCHTTGLGRRATVRQRCVGVVGRVVTAIDFRFDTVPLGAQVWLKDEVEAFVVAKIISEEANGDMVVMRRDSAPKVSAPTRVTAR